MRRVRALTFTVAAMLLAGAAAGVATPAAAATSSNLMPGVEIVGDSTVGPGEPIDLELVPTGPGTFLKIYNRPSWLAYDWTTQRITGIAPHQIGEHQSFTVIARNDHDAVSKLITIVVRPPLHPDVVEVLAVNETKPGSRAGTFSASCPADHPYLARFSDRYRDHRFVGKVNDLAEGRINPGGVRVIEPGGIAVSIHASGPGETELNGLFGLHDKVSYKTGIKGDYMNWNVDPTPLTVTLLCTSDQFGHGTTLYHIGSII